MEHITNIFVSILPEIIISTLAFICALLKHQITVLHKRNEDERQRAQGEYDTMKKSLCALLRADLVSEHHRLINDGFCPTYVYETYVNLYQQYTALGGNGMTKHLMNEINKLPTRRKK